MGENTCLRDGSSGFASGMRTWDAADISSEASTHTIQPHEKKSFITTLPVHLGTRGYNVHAEIGLNPALCFRCQPEGNKETVCM